MILATSWSLPDPSLAVLEAPFLRMETQAAPGVVLGRVSRGLVPGFLLTNQQEAPLCGTSEVGEACLSGSSQHRKARWRWDPDSRREPGLSVPTFHLILSLVHPLNLLFTQLAISCLHTYLALPQIQYFSVLSH